MIVVFIHTAYPQLINATLSITGLYMDLNFNIPTNKGGYGNDVQAPCSSFIDSLTLQLLGQQYSCTWKSGVQFRIVMGTNSSVSIGSNISLIANCIRTADNQSPFSPSQSSPLTFAPGTVITTKAIINAPSEIGSCENLTLNGANSQGQFGRELTYSWFISSSVDSILPASNQTNNISDSARNLLQNYLTNATAASIDIPQELLPPGYVYTFSLNVTNWVQQFNSVTKVVRKSSIPIPSVTISGGSGVPIVTTTNKQTILPSSVQVFPCSINSNETIVLYSMWSQLFQLTDFQIGVAGSNFTLSNRVIPFSQNALNLRNLVFAPYKLFPGEIYAFQVHIIYVYFIICIFSIQMIMCMRVYFSCIND